MALMVRTIQILAIPASRKRDNSPNTTDTRGLRQRRRIGGPAIDILIVSARGHAPMAHLVRRAGKLIRGVADQHAEARLERSHLLALVLLRNVVHGDAAIATQVLVGELRHAPVRAVAGAEVQDGGPVV